MTIEYNKVTWYSKLAAVILFGLVLLLGFYFGKEFQKAQDASTIANVVLRCVTNNLPAVQKVHTGVQK